MTTRTERWSGLRNRAMARKLISGRAIDISGCKRESGYYVLGQVVEGKDYCDAKSEAWIWSIGQRKKDGKILASLNSDLYQNPEFECLWLR
jgi:hypothetical protein